MFVYLHYNNREPSWASVLRQSGAIACYSPGLTFESQLEGLRPELENRNPGIVIQEHATVFQLDSRIFQPLEEAAPALVAADSLVDTASMVWRDQWLLSRADVLIAENGASTDLLILAKLWRIPCIGISFTPVGSHHWFAHCTTATLNSPETIEEILAILGWKASSTTADSGTDR